VPTNQLKIPQGYGLPVTIMNGKHGSFTIAEQQPDGSEVLIGKQKRAAELDRAGWDALLNDKEWSVEYLREGREDFPEIVRNAVSHIPHDKINFWPFYVVPKLDSWVSDRRRVIILGDAAHAIPPTAGQGVNQAFEDVYTFSLILASAKKDTSAKFMAAWQNRRQERVDRILELNAQIDARRVPGVDAVLAEKEFDLEWLYKPDFDDMVKGWIADC
jgi:2-polyprenyl-6-methoxyphenol hydroxylase-like FAD-dependent oxidoreductase